MRYNFWSDEIKNHELSNQPLHYAEGEKKIDKEQIYCATETASENNYI